MRMTLPMNAGLRLGLRYCEGDGADAVVSSGSVNGVAVVASVVGSDVDSLLAASLELGDVSGELGDESGELGDESGELGDESGELGDESGELGDESGELGDVAGELGDESGELGDVAGELGDVSGEVGDASGEVGGEVVTGLLGAGSLVPPVGVPVGDGVGVGVVPADTGGAWSRIPTISALNAFSWAETSDSEYVVICFPNSVRRPHTSPSACSCSSPGVSSTESTSWLAIAAVMHR
jgi:hypothetical protein